jgi:hypothetical protein
MTELYFADYPELMGTPDDENEGSLQQQQQRQQPRADRRPLSEDFNSIIYEDVGNPPEEETEVLNRQSAPRAVSFISPDCS